MIIRTILLLAALTSLLSCGKTATTSAGTGAPTAIQEPARETALESGSIWDLFNRPDPEVTVNVNKYIWHATLDVLRFLPIESVDPFTGIIVTGYGTPPGGSRSYRATAHIVDPALEARSLRLSLHSRGGLVSAGTTRAVEDAILSRARQLRIADGKL
ncbi:MAG: DUF3576 domain-containing protein [Rhodobacteraceae bacterium]|nr:DUF3576 domain-containing protein [Paracoccaceae bacterium]